LPDYKLSRRIWVVCHDKPLRLIAVFVRVNFVYITIPEQQDLGCRVLIVKASGW
jgi:hypothetical protein